MANKEIGYGYVVRTLGLRVTGYRLHAVVDSGVLALRTHGNVLHVPTGVAPSSEDPVTHLEFALKYQGVELEVIGAACGQLAPELVQARLDASPNGRYIRVLATLYERFTGKELRAKALTAPYVNLFDPDAYICGAVNRQSKFRVNMNDIGNAVLSPVIRRTPTLEKLLSRDVFADLDAFVQSIGGVQHLDRSLGWAYLDETHGSFAIEHEAPSEDKARRFVQILHGAHEGRALTEEYLAELQRSTITNPYLEAFAFRHEQNWLLQGGRLRASSVTYLPPPPDQARVMMEALMDFANAGDSIAPLVKAFLVSFAFVYIHPFMDGNGRISRFLVHHSLCRSGKLEQGLILPISMAMSHHESDYLTALQSVSKAIRELWDVTVLDDDHIDATFIGSANPYCYWDATEAIEFGVRMTHYALDTSLIKEADYLKRFDTVFDRINARYDVQGKDLSALIRMAHSHDGKLSLNRRKQYLYRVPSPVLDAIENEVQELFFGDDDIEE